MRSVPGRILITAATETEMKCMANIPGIGKHDGYMVYNGCRIERLVTGVGSVSMVWSMMNWLKSNPAPDICINIGIAGSFNPKYTIGDIIIPVSDNFADLGFEMGDSIKTVWESGLLDPDSFPFKKGELFCSSELLMMVNTLFPTVKGVTVNTVSGTHPTIARIRSKFEPDIETMEGAAFYYVCRLEKIPSIALRAISNIVEPRNRESWNIDLALENLSSGATKVLSKITS